MKKYAHYFMPVALLALLLIGVASVANAGTMPGQRRDEDVTRGELLNFDRFLDSHPGIARDLTKNPALINSSDYVEDHPELREFLKNHPEVREELKEQPRFFMKRERRFDRRERRRDDEREDRRERRRNG